MNYQEALKTREQNLHLIGKKLKGQEISEIVVIPIASPHVSVGEAAQKVVVYGHYSATPHAQDYELYVLFDLQNWSSVPSEPLLFDTLSNVLNKLTK